MWAKFYLAILVAAIGGTIMSSEVVPIAQSAVDDSALCASRESSTLDQAMNLVKEGFQVVKNLLGANRSQNNEVVIARKDLEDLKAACVSNQQKSSTLNVSSLCEYCVHFNAFVREFTIK